MQNVTNAEQICVTVHKCFLKMFILHSISIEQHVKKKKKYAIHRISYIQFNKIYSITSWTLCPKSAIKLKLLAHTGLCSNWKYYSSLSGFLCFHHLLQCFELWKSSQVHKLDSKADDFVTVHIESQFWMHFWKLCALSWAVLKDKQNQGIEVMRKKHLQTFCENNTVNSQQVSPDLLININKVMWGSPSSLNWFAERHWTSTWLAICQHFIKSTEK